MVVIAEAGGELSGGSFSAGITSGGGVAARRLWPTSESFGKKPAEDAG